MRPTPPSCCDLGHSSLDWDVCLSPCRNGSARRVASQGVAPLVQEEAPLPPPDGELARTPVGTRRREAVHECTSNHGPQGLARASSGCASRASDIAPERQRAISAARCRPADIGAQTHRTGRAGANPLASDAGQLQWPQASVGGDSGRSISACVDADEREATR